MIYCCIAHSVLRTPSYQSHQICALWYAGAASYTIQERKRTLRHDPLLWALYVPILSTCIHGSAWSSRNYSYWIPWECSSVWTRIFLYVRCSLICYLKSITSIASFLGSGSNEYLHGRATAAQWAMLCTLLHIVHCTRDSSQFSAHDVTVLYNNQ